MAYIELWVGFVVCVGTAAFILRFFARWKTVGFENFTYDDLFCFIGMIFYALDAALTYADGMISDIASRRLGSIVGLTATTAPLVPPEKAHDLSLGSASFTLLPTYTWLMATQADENLCTPIQRNWQVNPYPDNCILRKPNHALIGTLNILSDLGVMAIPLPILFAARMPLYRKLILGVLFCSGIFVIVAVILRVYFSLGDIGSLSTATSWALRESFISVITATAPGIKPLFNRSSWIESTMNETTHMDRKTAAASRLDPATRKSVGGNITTITGSNDAQRGVSGRQYIELGRSVNWPKKGKKDSVDVKNKELSASSSSQEHIVAENDDEFAIHVTTEYTLQHEMGSDSRLSSDFESEKTVTDIRSGS
ncbi:hypothetical protein NHQ30_008925 [Ciborinia camelliae]|nr:hypothetical protein NHQ30_008925 [Ciborinia camelliae]